LTAPLPCPECGNTLIEDLTVPLDVPVPRLYCLNCLRDAKKSRVESFAKEYLDDLREARHRLLFLKKSFPELLDNVIQEGRRKETHAQRMKNQPFYDFLGRALLEGSGHSELR